MYISNHRYITCEGSSSSLFMYFPDDLMYYRIYVGSNGIPYFIVNGVRNYLTAEEREYFYISLFHMCDEE